ncbi:MAG: LD-carboxypeptidase [Prevotellaceae bacterium]|jgi:muramoyltetrapeptide carboxypeptidase|nr:LD-carboxypeptidase [Prevotellaceae bacterium]
MMNMVQPPYLKKNDTITIVAPAGRINGAHIANAIKHLRRWGFRTKIGDHATDAYYGLAGVDEHRCVDLQAAIDDPKTSAILCARGGYGCGRIVDWVDFSPLLTTPKWLIGFSDITVLHARLQRIGLQSIHGVMPKYFPTSTNGHESAKSLRQALTGRLQSYTVPPHVLNKPGTARGVLRGGNLSILANIAATPDDIAPDGAILFIEETDESPYTIDRMMNNLQRSGKLRRVAGVIVGQFTNIKKDPIMPFSKEVYKLLAPYLSHLAVPVCYGFPAGHGEPNYALYLGREVVLEVSGKRAPITGKAPKAETRIYYI